MKKRILILLSIIFLLIVSGCKPKEKEVPNEGRVYYEIFVRSFADSDGDKVGDFNGITQKLDYLQDLGIGGIWLMPMFPSPSYHGYDITDYYDVNSDYGTMEDFENLLKEAEKRDINVIIDFVINHTSADHEWFEKAKDPNSKYRDYYNFINRDDPKTGPWYSNAINGGSSDDFYYAYFWDQMPDVNFDNEEVRNEFIKAAKFWLDKGVDGFRLDAALHIYTEDELYNTDRIMLIENVDFWKEFQSTLEKDYPDVYLVGEVWANTSVVAPFFGGLDSNFNFTLADHLIENAGKEGDRYYTKQIQMMYDKYERVSEDAIDAPFLRNHDQNRLMSELNGDIEKNKFLAEMYLTLKGTPFIYYGEEIGMKGQNPHEDIRLPFVWTDDDSDLDATWRRDYYNTDIFPANQQINDDDSLFNTYKTLINLRKNNSALARGDFNYVKSDETSIQMFIRINEEEEQAILVVHNFKRSEMNANILYLDELNIIYQSESNEGKDKDTFAPKSTKIFVVPLDKANDYLP